MALIKTRMAITKLVDDCPSGQKDLIIYCLKLDFQVHISLCTLTFTLCPDIFSIRTYSKSMKTATHAYSFSCSILPGLI